MAMGTGRRRILQAGAGTALACRPSGDCVCLSTPHVGWIEKVSRIFRNA